MHSKIYRHQEAKDITGKRTCSRMVIAWLESEGAPADLFPVCFFLISSTVAAGACIFQRSFLNFRFNASFHDSCKGHLTSSAKQSAVTDEVQARRRVPGL